MSYKTWTYLHELVHVFGGTTTTLRPNNISLLIGANNINAINVPIINIVTNTGFQHVHEPLFNRWMTYKRRLKNYLIALLISDTYSVRSKPLLWSHRSNSSFSDVTGMRLPFCKLSFISKSLFILYQLRISLWLMLLNLFCAWKILFWTETKFIFNSKQSVACISIWYLLIKQLIWISSFQK